MEYIAFFWSLLLKYGVALLPAALGAGVAQLLQKGLSWGERFVQVVVGIAVSHFATLAIVAWLKLDPVVGQSVSFVLGMIGYHATPGLIASISDALKAVPGRLLNLIPGKKEGDA